MKSIGITKIPNNVAVVIPATTVIPMDTRAPAPAPVSETPPMRSEQVVRPAPAPALSDREIQSVVGEAGRALRGQA